jgi:alkanesulfonate monooxygenase SsuD/methylene tetrahydromethanopterin reductase-like flavin-dependent oxidoreductase (luciferase family)
MPAARRPLKIGLLLPETEGQFNGGTARWSDLLAMTKAAEAVGFDSVWVTDHFIQRSETETRGPWECWSLLAAIAAVTERVEIGPLVVCTGFRNPALLAKMADTVEEISGGRLILGLGAGWNEPEYRAFGYPFDHRVDRFEEALTIIQGLLRDGHVDFDGVYYQARDCELRPRGPRPQGPPILVGTTGKRMLGLTARHADQWNVWFSSTGNRVEGITPLLASVDAACVAAGRDPATLERTAAVVIEVGPHAPSTMSAPPITGSPEEIATSLRAHAATGLSHVQVWLEPATVAGVEAFAPVLELLDRG